MRGIRRRGRMIFFVVVFLLVYLLSEAGMLYIHCRNEQIVTDDYDIVCENAARGLCDFFGSLINTAAQTSNMLFRQTWYNHLRNRIGYYEDEFDASSKQEIVDSIRRTAASLPFVSDEVIIIPTSDIVICKNGWFTLNQYQKVYGDVHVTVTDSDTGDFILESDHPYILLDDPNPRRDYSRIALLIDIVQMKNTLESLLPEETASVCMQIEGMTAIASGDEQKVRVFTVSYLYPSLTLTLGFRPVDLTGLRVTFALLSLVLFLLFVIIGMIASYRIMRPVRRLVLESGGSKRDLQEPYSYVRSYISQLKDSQNRLLTANRDRENEMNHLQELARADLLYGLIAGRRLDLENTAPRVFPWLSENGDMCLLGLTAQGGSTESIIKADLLNTVSHFVQTDVNEGLFALIWFGEEMSREERDEYRLLLRHEWGKQNGAMCFVSLLLHTLSQVESACVEMKKDMMVSRRIASALPEETRLFLIDCVQNGSIDDLKASIRRLIGNYEPRDALNVIRFAVDQPPAAADEEPDWEHVFAEAERAVSSQMRETAETAQDAQKYVDWIDRHFNDSELSVTVLAEQFNRHRTIISKEIKMVTGYSFSDYLRNKRISEALMRIDGGNENIMQIATEVGYVSYSTFKRAFIQITGKTPMEYRDERQLPVKV